MVIGDKLKSLLEHKELSQAQKMSQRKPTGAKRAESRTRVKRKKRGCRSQCPLALPQSCGVFFEELLHQIVTLHKIIHAVAEQFDIGGLHRRIIVVVV